MVRFLRECGARAKGVECQPASLDAARKADADHAEAYVKGVGQDLPFDDRSFDLVTFIFSLHHVPSHAMDTALAEAARVTRPGGHVYVAEPLIGGPGFELERLIDDEPAVRQAARAALARAGAHGLESLDVADYVSAYTYGDVEDYLADMVGVDPARKAVCERNDMRIRETFARAGREVAGGRQFEQPVRVDLFVRR